MKRLLLLWLRFIFNFVLQLDEDEPSQEDILKAIEQEE